jgi:hypothetical protein
MPLSRAFYPQPGAKGNLNFSDGLLTALDNDPKVLVHPGPLTQQFACFWQGFQAIQ